MSETLSDQLREAAGYFPGSELEVACQRAADIIDKLPRTVDGMPIVPGMKVWHIITEPQEWIVRRIRQDHSTAPMMIAMGIDEDQAAGCSALGRQLYSTREAALAAAGKESK